MGKPNKKKIAEMVVLNDLGKSARQIGAQTGHSPNTVAKYLADSASLNDSKVKELVARYRETECDHLTLLGGKARALLEERLDEKKMTNIEAIALTDRFFTQRRLLEDKSTANVGLRGILKLQTEALEKTMKAIAGKTEENDTPQRPGRPRTKRKPATNP